MRKYKNDFGEAMEFKRIPKNGISQFSGYIDSQSKFKEFVEKFDVEGVNWSQPQNIIASYFLRLLLDGSSVKARGNRRKGYGNELDECSMEL